MVVKRRRRLPAQRGALANGDKQGHAVAGRPEHTLAEEMSTRLYQLPCRVHDPTEHARVEIKWPLDNPIEDLPFYLHDPSTVNLLAEKAKTMWEEAFGDAMEILPMLFLVIEDKVSAPANAIVEGTKRSIYNSIVDEALSVFAVSPWRDHNTLLNAAMVGNMKIILMLPREDVDVNKADAIENISIDWFLSVTSSTKEPRTVWLLPVNSIVDEHMYMILQYDKFCELSHLQKQANMSKIFIECLLSSCNSEYLTPEELQRSDFQAAFLMELRDSDHFLLGICRMCVVTAGNGTAADNSLLPEPSFFRLTELSSRSSLTTNVTVDSPQDIDRQQLDACSKSDIQIQHNDECSRRDTESQLVEASRTRCKMVPIFIKHCSGEVVLTVNLDEPSEHMMHLFEKTTKMKLEQQYFRYGNHQIDPKCSLLSYGVGCNATVDALSRLLGGKTTTLGEYCAENKGKFLRRVPRPDGKESVDMEKKGCRILSSWLKCFTKTFAKGKSWAGQFSLEYFKVVNGHVKVLIIARLNLDSSNLKADLTQLVCLIRSIFSLGTEYPPYLENLIVYLETRTYPTLVRTERLYIETHMSCIESFDRGMLLVLLRKKYKSLCKAQKRKWKQIVLDAELPGNTDYCSHLSRLAVFKDIIAKAESTGKKYKNKKNSIFSLMRDEFTHGTEHRFDKSVTPWKENFKDDDGIELMIPAHVDDLAAKIIESLVESGRIDITTELRACQVRCYCSHCKETLDTTKATGPKPSDDKDGSGPGPSSSKQATGLGFSSCAGGGTDSGPSQQAESSSKKGAQTSSSSISGPSQQAESSMKKRTPVSYASLFKNVAPKPPSFVPPQKPQSSEANKPERPPPEDDDGFQTVKSKKGNRRR